MCNMAKATSLSKRCLWYVQPHNEYCVRTDLRAENLGAAISHLSVYHVCFIDAQLCNDL